jgi:hypothetical protein
MTVRLYNPANASPDLEKGRMRSGKPPLPEQGPQLLARLLDDTDATTWCLTWVRYNIGKPHERLPQPKLMDYAETGWYYCKLHVDGHAKYKANFWLSISVEKARLSSRWDCTPLREFRPRLEQAVWQLLTAMKGFEGLDLELHKPVYDVRPNGAGWRVSDTSEQGRWRALLAELDAMNVGAQRSYALAELPMLREAKGAMHPKSFNGAPDPLTGGVLVTRTV